jgi:hypothetical protein
MRYAYRNLGEQQEGCTAVVRWSGAPATVMLFDPVNFHKYVDRLPWHCDTGGRYRRSPARLPIPQRGRWFAVVDFGGNSAGRPPTVEVVGREAAARKTEPGEAEAMHRVPGPSPG